MCNINGNTHQRNLPSTRIRILSNTLPNKTHPHCRNTTENSTHEAISQIIAATNKMDSLVIILVNWRSFETKRPRVMLSITFNIFSFLSVRLFSRRGAGSTCAEYPTVELRTFSSGAFFEFCFALFTHLSSKMGWSCGILTQKSQFIYTEYEEMPPIKKKKRVKVKNCQEQGKTFSLYKRMQCIESDVVFFVLIVSLL